VSYKRVTLVRRGKVRGGSTPEAAMKRQVRGNAMPARQISQEFPGFNVSSLPQSGCVPPCVPRRPPQPLFLAPSCSFIAPYSLLHHKIPCPRALLERFVCARAACVRLCVCVRARVCVCIQNSLPEGAGGRGLRVSHWLSVATSSGALQMLP